MGAVPLTGAIWGTRTFGRLAVGSAGPAFLAVARPGSRFGTLGAWVPRLFFSDVMGSHTRPETFARMCFHALIEVIYITRSHFRKAAPLTRCNFPHETKSIMHRGFTGSRRHHPVRRNVRPKSPARLLRFSRPPRNTCTCDPDHCRPTTTAAESTSSIRCRPSLFSRSS